MLESTFGGDPVQIPRNILSVFAKEHFGSGEVPVGRFPHILLICTQNENAPGPTLFLTGNRFVPHL